jgi:hypothetical protein
LIRNNSPSIFTFHSNTGDSVLSFLQEFQRNSLLTNANLDFSAIYPPRFPHFMTNIWPMLTTINSIKIEGDALDSIQCEHFDLAKPLLASARILHTKFVFSVIKIAKTCVVQWGRIKKRSFYFKITSMRIRSIAQTLSYCLASRLECFSIGKPNFRHPTQGFFNDSVLRAVGL